MKNWKKDVAVEFFRMSFIFGGLFCFFVGACQLDAYSQKDSPKEIKMSNEEFSAHMWCQVAGHEPCRVACAWDLHVSPCDVFFDGGEAELNCNQMGCSRRPQYIVVPK